MSGLTFSLARNSPLRTTLIDETTGHAMYQIDTPRKLQFPFVTKIRKLDPVTPPPDDDDSESDDDPTDKKHVPLDVDEVELPIELPETSDEMARIYWRFTSPDNIVLRGKTTTSREFLPECGKMKG